MLAIISHPDAGKTTITEKLLLFECNLIKIAGTIKSKKSDRHATSTDDDGTRRGISVTSSVMQFPYKDRVVNLLDTQGMKTFRKTHIGF